MSDNLAERLKNLAREQAQGKQVEIDQQKFQERVNTFISDHAREEYDNLIRLLKERAEQMNSNIGDLPKFVPSGYFIQQSNMALYFHFDKPIVNRPENALLLSVGPAPNTMYMFEPGPTPVRYQLHAAASDDFSSIVWVGDLGELKSAQLVDVVLEQLTVYYLQHKRN
jgi:hypothetical protein